MVMEGILEQVTSGYRGTEDGTLKWMNGQRAIHFEPQRKRKRERAWLLGFNGKLLVGGMSCMGVERAGRDEASERRGRLMKGLMIRPLNLS